MTHVKLREQRSKLEFSLVPICCRATGPDLTNLRWTPRVPSADLILRCCKLAANRHYHLSTLRKLLGSYYSESVVQMIFDCQDTLLQVILDCTHPSLMKPGIKPNLWSICDEVEPVTRLMCYSLHVMRCTLTTAAASVNDT